jgi:hypothetical protein
MDKFDQTQVNQTELLRITISQHRFTARQVNPMTNCKARYLHDKSVQTEVIQTELLVSRGTQ